LLVFFSFCLQVTADRKVRRGGSRSGHHWFLAAARGLRWRLEKTRRHCSADPKVSQRCSCGLGASNTGPEAFSCNFQTWMCVFRLLVFDFWIFVIFLNM
jgi:hypothetical protein